VIDEQTLDRVRHRLNVRRTIVDGAEGQIVHHSVRLYDAGELRCLLAERGFAQVEIFGGWEGEPVSADSLRLVAVARGGGTLKA
jgi:hypothetical protein